MREGRENGVFKQREGNGDWVGGRERVEWNGKGRVDEG